MKLIFREWFFLAILLGSVGCVVMTSQLKQRASKNIWRQQKLDYTQALIEINVAGAVISPGVYKFPPGISIKEILVQAGLSKKADKKKINFKRKVFAPANLQVPEMEKIEVNKTRVGKRNKKRVRISRVIASQDQQNSDKS